MTSPSNQTFLSSSNINTYSSCSLSTSLCIQNSTKELTFNSINEETSLSPDESFIIPEETLSTRADDCESSDSLVSEEIV